MHAFCANSFAKLVAVRNPYKLLALRMYSKFKGSTDIYRLRVNRSCANEQRDCFVSILKIIEKVAAVPLNDLKRRAGLISALFSCVSTSKA